MLEPFQIIGILVLFGFTLFTIVTYLLVRKIKESQIALAESEEKFRVLAERSVAGVYIIQNGIFKYVNPRMAEILKVNVDDLIGETPLKFVHPEDRLTVTQNLKKRIEGEEEFVHYTVRVISKNGETVTVEVFGSMATIGGKPAIIGTLLDITETVRLNRLLRIINDISKTIVREKDKNEILRSCKRSYRI